MSAQLISDEDAANQDTGHTCQVDRRACQESLAAKLKVGGGEAGAGALNIRKNGISDIHSDNRPRKQR